MKRALLLIFFITASVSQAGETPAAPSPFSKVPPELQAATITEKLGQTVAAGDITFHDEQGKAVQLKEFFHPGRPVILTMVYYGCPTLCGFFLTGLTDSLKPLDWTPGGRFEIVTVSINHREDPELA